MGVRCQRPRNSVRRGDKNVQYVGKCPRCPFNSESGKEWTLKGDFMLSRAPCTENRRFASSQRDAVRRVCRACKTAIFGAWHAAQPRIKYKLGIRGPTRDVLGPWFSPGKRVGEALIARYSKICHFRSWQVTSQWANYMSYISLLSGGNLVCPKPFVLYLSF